MKVGDYVRTKSYGIKKINGFSSTLEEDFIDCDYDKTTRILINKKDIVKSSPNIIALIEPWDLLYIDIEYGFAGGLVVPRIYETQAELDEAIEKIKNDKERELVGIVTHEQLDNMTYDI